MHVYIIRQGKVSCQNSPTNRLEISLHVFQHSTQKHREDEIANYSDFALKKKNKCAVDFFTKIMDKRLEDLRTICWNQKTIRLPSELLPPQTCQVIFSAVWYRKRNVKVYIHTQLCSCQYIANNPKEEEQK